MEHLAKNLNCLNADRNIGGFVVSGIVTTPYMVEERDIRETFWLKLLT